VVRTARAGLGQVYIADHLLKMVTEVNVTLGIAGHRGTWRPSRPPVPWRRCAEGWSFPPPTCATRSDLPSAPRPPDGGERGAGVPRERLLSWAFPGEVDEEEDRGPVVPLPGRPTG